MELNFGGIGFKFSPQEIAYGLQRLSAYINKDKNSICLVLDLISQNISDWDSEINSFVINQMTEQLTQRKGTQIPKQDIHRTFRITLDPKRNNAAAQSVYILQNIEKQYDLKNLKFLSGDDIDKLVKIRTLINGESAGSQSLDWVMVNARTKSERERLRRGFAYLARNDNDVTNLGSLLKGYGGQKSVKKLQSWLNSLGILKYLIMEITTSFLFSLDCQEQGIDALRRQVFKKKST